MKLSVIIPSFKDPLLQKTIDSLLGNSGLGDQLEVIPVFDGYLPAIPLKLDDRVKIVHLGKNRGMRGAINAGVLVSTGEYIMRTDEHCVFGDNYDLILTSQMKDNWIVTPRRYFLDPVKWEVMDISPVDKMDLKIRGGKFTGVEVKGNGEPLEEATAMQGSVWCLKRKLWNDVIKELDTETYGPLIQDSHEMIFKIWQNDGKLMVNRNTWHAHKHRSFPRMHNNGTEENPARCEYGYAQAIKIWGDYYKEIKEKWGI